MERTVAKVIAAIAVAGGLVTGCQPAAEAGTSARTASESPRFESPTGLASATAELSAPSLESPSAAATAPPAPESTCDPTGNSVRTDFRHGTATLKFTSGDHDIATLDQIADTTFYANFDPACPGGAQAEWTNASDEWLLTVLANLGPNHAFGDQWATLWIDGDKSNPPLYADGAPCKITITEESPAGLVGHAECQGLRWLDGYEAAANPSAKPIPNLPPFDVLITFEARP